MDKFDAACRLIKAACGEEYGDGETVTDIGIGIAEPGYGNDETIWVTGNWNPARFVRKGDGQPPLTNDESRPVRLGNALERLGVELLWLDEWIQCGQCMKVVRSEPDSYSWTPYYLMGEDDCQPYCLDCFATYYGSDDSGLRDFGFIDNPRNAIPDHIKTSQLEAWGWERHNGVFENGWYHREDDPQQIFDRIKAESPQLEVLFAIDENQQFCIRFTAWVKSVAGYEHDNGVVEVFRVDDYQDDNPGVDIATCGECGRSWDDSHSSGLTPAPSGRCPFEYEHEGGE